MENKKIFWAILGIAAIIALVIFFLPKENNKIGQILEIGSKSEKESKMQLIAINEQTPLYKANALYPRFSGIDESFNKIIKDEAENAWLDFKKITQENWNALKDTEFGNQKNGDNPAEPFEFDLSCDIIQQTDDYVSLIMRYGGYPGGGAHGYQNLITFTYNVKDKKISKLSDFFSGKADYLEKISKVARQQLIEHFSEDIQDEQGLGYVKEMIDMGTEPKEDNFKNFTISQDKIITIYFPQYQVAPYAAGEQKIEINLNNEI
ncbi:MAG TPA: DUF3298 domain-containing protein [Candidatus Pacearchaeota archaeon]|nr:DUF3298 domain-containing protein [Candidatus Parcubacteria bacterium]HNZ83772.1 DUF3298 domain-containing protein [Candidatus Pacearchaeota archaeon]HOU45963.1 DUF3298 domain-containing protein [Candidatus Pacearchaeota archaeon]HPM08751.1 DUF3298 domain-containing protein [Candidatus Pacearchaeota archaeon]HQI74638.1 DUF3298 domain-containing protein [Candidatus Pacearchaeota archaeon]